MCVAVCDEGLFLLSCPLVSLLFQRAGLEEGVTDSGLRALGSGGCGEKLTSLSLLGECCCVPVCELMVCGSGRGHARYMLLSITGALSPLFSSFLLAFVNAQIWKRE